MKGIIILKTIVFGIMVLTIIGCEEKEDTAFISSLEPMSGDYNAEVIIQGNGLIGNSGLVSVTFGNNVNATIISATETQVVTKVPVGATSGKITVHGKSTITSGEPFVVTGGSWTKKTDFNKTITSSDVFFSIGNLACIHLVKRVNNGTPIPASFWLFNSLNNTWNEGETLDSEISPGDNSIGWGTNDKGYILRHGKLYEYNFTADEWTLKSDPPVAVSGNIINAFYVHAVDKTYAVLKNGAFYSYDPVNDVWGFIQNAPFSSSIISSSGSKILKGSTNHGYCIIGKQLWRLNTTTNQWNQLPDSPGSEDNDFAFTQGDDLFTGISSENNFWVYKASTNEWIQKASLMPFRYWPVYFTLENKGYVGFGARLDDSRIINELHVYNP